MKKKFSVMVCMRYISALPGNVFACLHRSSGIKALFICVLIACWRDDHRPAFSAWLTAAIDFFFLCFGEFFFHNLSIKTKLTM